MSYDYLNTKSSKSVISDEKIDKDILSFDIQKPSNEYLVHFIIGITDEINDE